MRSLLEDRPLSALQIWAIALTIGLNALDGFDVGSISFAAPGITREWGIDRSSLGIVLTMELIGMAVGSILLGGIADRIGRRPTVLGCLVVMAIGMAATPFARDLVQLSVWRIVTGLGIGGMIPALNALAAEYANARTKRLAVSLMVIGYPIGLVVGGSIAAWLLRDNNPIAAWLFNAELLNRNGQWRMVFGFGAIVTALFIPLSMFLTPESPAHIASRRPAAALDKINRILKRMRHPPVTELPAAEPAARVPIASLFTPGLAMTTILVTIGYFAHITVFYYVLKWTPTIVTDMGYHPSSAAGVLVWVSAGGILGGAAFGFAAQRFGLKPMTMLAFFVTTATLVIFGLGAPDLPSFSFALRGIPIAFAGGAFAGLCLIAALAGVAIQAGIVGLYAIFAEVFPTQVRAAGTGFVIGAGRAGALLAPVIAGFLFDAGMGLQLVSTLIGAAALLAAIAIGFVKLSGAEAPAATARSKAA